MELTSYIVNLFLTLEGVFLMAIFIFVISNLKLNWVQILKYVVFNSLFMLGMDFVSNQILYLVVSQLGFLVIQYFTIKQSFNKTALTWILTSFVTLVLQFVPFIALKVYEIQDEFIYHVFGSLLHSISFIVLILIIYKLKLKILPKSFDKVEDNKIVSMIISLVVTVTLIAVNAYFSFEIIGSSSFALLVLNFILATLLFVFNTYNTNKSCQLIVTEKELEYQRIYNKTLNDLVDGLRTFKHDYANVLNCIKGYIDLKNLEGLNNYFSDVLGDYFKVSKLAVLSDLTEKNPAVYSLITAKLYSAESKQVNINVSSSTDLSNSCIREYELSKVLGILLDNAIEEALKTEEKIVNISITENLRDCNYCFIVENSTNRDVDVHKIFERNYSSKGAGRGLGLWEVRNILNRYDGACLITSCKNNRFSQELYVGKN